jgi:hypothetical protein
MDRSFASALAASVGGLVAGLLTLGVDAGLPAGRHVTAATLVGAALSVQSLGVLAALGVYRALTAGGRGRRSPRR